MRRDVAPEQSPHASVGRRVRDIRQVMSGTNDSKLDEACSALIQPLYPLYKRCPSITCRPSGRERRERRTSPRLSRLTQLSQLITKRRQDGILNLTLYTRISKLTRLSYHLTTPHHQLSSTLYTLAELRCTPIRSQPGSLALSSLTRLYLVAD